MASANGKSFLNMATGGFGTEAAKQTDSDLKDKVGGAAYLITGEPIKVVLSALHSFTVHPQHHVNHNQLQQQSYHRRHQN